MIPYDGFSVSAPLHYLVKPLIRLPCTPKSKVFCNLHSLTGLPPLEYVPTCALQYLNHITSMTPPSCCNSCKQICPPSITTSTYQWLRLLKPESLLPIRGLLPSQLYLRSEYVYCPIVIVSRATSSRVV